ncbi:MAG: hypothetical protein QM539_08075, partial [Alphaproteobacteria bacterium]|nr:hypothetical protein [Alphaproteobacteria bacterium]
ISYVVPSNLPIRIMSFKKGKVLDSFNSFNLNNIGSGNQFKNSYHFFSSDTAIQNKYNTILNNFVSGYYIFSAGYFSNYYDSTIIYFDSTKIKKYFHNPNNINNNYFYELDCLKGDRLRCVNDYFIDTIANNVRSSVIRYLYIFSEIDYQTADTIIR